METMHKPTEVGAIWCTSWGYDQTNVEFWKVVKETKATITLRRIGSEVIDGRLYPWPHEGCVDRLLDRGAEGEARDVERGYSEKVCRYRTFSYRGDGSISYAAKIDYCRTARPYEGGGQYDTHAAGQPGH